MSWVVADTVQVAKYKQVTQNVSTLRPQSVNSGCTEATSDGLVSGQDTHWSLQSPGRRDRCCEVLITWFLLDQFLVFWSFFFLATDIRYFGSNSNSGKVGGDIREDVIGHYKRNYPAPKDRKALIWHCKRAHRSLLFRLSSQQRKRHSEGAVTPTSFRSLQ